MVGWHVENHALRRDAGYTGGDLARGRGAFRIRSRALAEKSCGSPRGNVVVVVVVDYTWAADSRALRTCVPMSEVTLRSSSGGFV